MICVQSRVAVFEDNARKISCPYISDHFRLNAVGHAHRAMNGFEFLTPQEAYELIRSYAAASKNFLMVAEDISESIEMRTGAIAAIGSGAQQLHDSLGRLRAVPAFSMQEHTARAIDTVPLLMTAKAEIRFQELLDGLIDIIADPREDVELCTMALGSCATINEFCKEIPGAVNHDQYARNLDALAYAGPMLGF